MIEPQNSNECRNLDFNLKPRSLDIYGVKNNEEDFFGKIHSKFLMKKRRKT
jgi:hypothetical protein